MQGISVKANLNFFDYQMCMCVGRYLMCARKLTWREISRSKNRWKYSWEVVGIPPLNYRRHSRFRSLGNGPRLARILASLSTLHIKTSFKSVLAGVALKIPQDASPKQKELKLRTPLGKWIASWTCAGWRRALQRPAFKCKPRTKKQRVVTAYVTSHKHLTYTILSTSLSH